MSSSSNLCELCQSITLDSLRAETGYAHVSSWRCFKLGGVCGLCEALFVQYAGLKLKGQAYLHLNYVAGTPYKQLFLSAETTDQLNSELGGPSGFYLQDFLILATEGTSRKKPRLVLRRTHYLYSEHGESI